MAAKKRKKAARARRPKRAQIVAAQRSDIDPGTFKALALTASWGFHYGNVTGLGYFSTAGGREVVIQWDEGGASRKQGGISDEQWEIFRLAFEGTGRIMVLSDKSGSDWKFDYRFLEAQR